MELIPKIKKYEWGKPGDESTVAKLYKMSHPDLVIDKTPFAELWMGTHFSGPSKLKSSGANLADIISENESYLGEASIQKFGKNLPFLFKVLSINKPLSIQAHPSKKHAEELHSKQPNLYQDPNHKPELAIALTEFKAMCGFRPISEVQGFLRVVPELREVLGQTNADKLIDTTESDADNNLRTCFKALVTCPAEKLNIQLSCLLQRFKNLDPIDRDQQLSKLIESLNSHFPNDVGCFAPYFLNVLTLQPGEAIYLGANEPHAYLHGDCIECMACSDNVVRAGLTPKFKDVETLCAMLNYNGAPASEKVFQPIKENDFTCTFRPPVPDFAVAKINIPKTSNKTELIKRNIASIVLCTEGDAIYDQTHIITPGTIIFIPAGETFEITNVKADLSLYQAMANV